MKNGFFIDNRVFLLVDILNCLKEYKVFFCVLFVGYFILLFLSFLSLFLLFCELGIKLYLLNKKKIFGFTGQMDALVYRKEIKFKLLCWEKEKKSVCINKTKFILAET